MKKNSLSAWKFIWNNKRKLIVLIIAISLSFMAMYTVKFVFGSTGESFKPIMLENPNDICYVDLTNKTLGINGSDYNTDDEFTFALQKRRDEVIASLKAIDGIDEVYYGQLLDARYNCIVGNMSYEFPLLKPEMVEAYLSHMNATLSEGKLPVNDGDVLVDSVVMKNNHFKVGDFFFPENYGKTFKIVGTIVSKSMACVGIPNGYTNCGWAFMIYCNETTKDARALFQRIGISLSENDLVIDSEKYLDFYESDVESVINTSLAAISLIVVLFLAVAIIVAYVSFLRNRVDEYCLYTSIGYSRLEIYKMIMKEILILFGFSILLGTIIAIIVVKLLALLLLEPIGVVYCYWYPEQILTIFATYIAIIGVLQIPIVYAINSVKTIDKLED